MEPGNRAAGHRSEQDGEHVLYAVSIVHSKAGKRRELCRVDVGMGSDDAHQSHGQHGIEQERAQIVTGLQQNPYRRHRGDGDIDAYDDHPGIGGEIQWMEVHADGHDDYDGDDAQDGGYAHGHVPAVYGKSERNGNQDEQQRYHGDGGIGSACHLVESARLVILRAEGGCNDGCECGHHQNQSQIGENQEQPLCPLAHVGGDDLTDRLPLVADGREQRAEVMHAAEEDAADQDPQHHRHPAEHGRADRACDGARARDGRKMMSHQDRGLGGNIIHSVLHGMGRGLLLALAHAPLLAQPSAVEDISTYKDGYGNHNQY